MLVEMQLTIASMQKSHIQSLDKGSNESQIGNHQKWSHLDSIDYESMLTHNKHKKHIPCWAVRQVILLVWGNREEPQALQ